MNIFIAKSGNRQGPYSIDQLKDLIRRREVSMSDNAWFEGCTEWTRISDMPELLAAVLPPLPTDPSPGAVAPTNKTMAVETTTRICPAQITKGPSEAPRGNVNTPPATGTDWLRVVVAAMVIMTMLIVAPLWVFLLALGIGIWMAFTGKFNRKPKQNANS